MPRKNSRKPADIPMEVPLETAPLEVPREDMIPREDVHMADAETVREARREEAIPTRDLPPPPPAINKTQSELNIEDSLITSFVNNAKSRDIEVVFAFDTTGSMNSYLAEVRKKLKETCEKLTKDIPSIKIGIMAFGDYCDYHNYVCMHQDLCNDTAKLVNWVETVKSTGGGDAPEAYELALREAKALSWSPIPQVNKAFVVIGDATPHAPSYTSENIYWRSEVSDLVKKGVKIYGVHCNSNTDSRPFYEEVAEMSGGICLTLKHLQLITDMFKAVCYREFGAEHLETYRTEVAEGGRMDNNMEELFAQLKQGPNAKAQLGERSKADWYLQQYDKGTTHPYYSYNTSTNKWQPYSAFTAAATAPLPTPVIAPKRKDDKSETTSSPKPAKKAKTEKKSPKKPVKKEVTKKTSPKATPKKAKTGAKKEKKVEVSSEEEEEEAPKTLTKGSSVIVGTGEWKRDRYGRMASLHDA